MFLLIATFKGKLTRTFYDFYPSVYTLLYVCMYLYAEVVKPYKYKNAKHFIFYWLLPVLVSRRIELVLALV